MKNPFRRNDATKPDAQGGSAVSSPSAAPSLEPSPAVLAHLDELNAACRAAPNEIDPQIRLWQAVVALDQWVFINRGTAESPRPYALAAEAGMMSSIYSSAARAQESAVTNGLVPDGTSVPLLAVPMPAAIDWVLSFAEHGVTGVTIDYPRLGAWCPMPNLVRLRAMR